MRKNMRIESCKNLELSKNVIVSKEDILNQEEQSSRKIDPIGHLAALAPEDVQGLKNTNFTQPMTHN